ncbi:hypothetical protein CPB85DRAFT_1445127 [Mucidula mucida]|nr:hypothetical protein CPB85DRAFT_1445127 [Mucidula mucida]
MSYRWMEDKREQYSDGHEREDVHAYCQDVFIPTWQKFELCGRYWDEKDADEKSINAVTIKRDAKECAAKYGNGRIIMIWRHNELTFYAHDQRKLGWRHDGAKAEINPKGEGASEMVGDFVSPDHGWLRPDLTITSTFEDHIIAQATRAMDILDRDYPDEHHIFAYDNATIHSARAPDALSAMKMIAGPSHNFNKVKRGQTTTQTCMRDTTFQDGTPQNLYNADGSDGPAHL